MKLLLPLLLFGFLFSIQLEAFFEPRVCEKTLVPRPPFYQVRRYELKKGQVNYQPNITHTVFYKDFAYVSAPTQQNPKRFVKTPFLVKKEMRIVTDEIDHVLKENLRSLSPKMIYPVFKGDLVILKSENWADQEVYDYLSHLYSYAFMKPLTHSTPFSAKKMTRKKIKKSNPGITSRHSFLNSKNTNALIGHVFSFFENQKTELFNNFLSENLYSQLEQRRVQVDILRSNKTYSRLFTNRHFPEKNTGYLNINSLYPLLHQFAYINEREKDQLLCPQVSFQKDPLNNEKFSFLGPKFYVHQCQTDSLEQVPLSIKKLYYLFDAYTPLAQKVHSLPPKKINPKKDGPFLKPVHLKHTEGLLRVYKTLDNIYKEEERRHWFQLKHLEVDYRGFISLPRINQQDYHLNDGEAIDGSYVRYKNHDPLESETWGHPNNICAIMKLSHAWKSYCPKSAFIKKYPDEKRRLCKLEIGDIAYLSTSYSRKSYRKIKKAGLNVKKYAKDPAGHKTHKSGHCFDMRPLRAPYKIASSRGQKYSVELTKEFIQFLFSYKEGIFKPSLLYYYPLGYKSKRRAFAKTFLPTNSKIKEFVKSTGNPRNHSNHLHICYEPNQNNTDQYPLCSPLKKKLCSETLNCNFSKNSNDPCRGLSL